MNRKFKFFIKIILLIVVVLAIDTFQALIFNNAPLFSIREDYNGGTLYSVHRGLIVDTYNCTSGKTHSIIKGFSYSCTDITDFKIVDKTKEISNFSCAEALEEIYIDEFYVYYLECMKSKYIEVVYMDGKRENIKDALKNGNVTINDLNKFDIKYIKYAK